MPLNSYKFSKNGFEYIESCYPKILCKSLNNEIYRNRDIKKIFLSKKEYFRLKKKKSIIKGNNPRPGRNLLHKLNCSFLFENIKFIKSMQKILGPYYKILDFKLVMGVPISIIPKWIIQRTYGYHSVNLGSYIKPKYRDITYFKGLDLHQDIIDYPDRNADFITAYIYLDSVKQDDSPLYVIPNSHKLGADIFPHKITEQKKNNVIYEANKKKIKAKLEMLKGKSGTLSYWHPFILHGTKPHKFDKPRISVRLLVEKNRRSYIGCLLDKVNLKIKGNITLKKTRSDLNKRGSITKKNNFINKIK